MRIRTAGLALFVLVGCVPARLATNTVRIFERSEISPAATTTVTALSAALAFDRLGSPQHVIVSVSERFRCRSELRSVYTERDISRGGHNSAIVRDVALPLGIAATTIGAIGFVQAPLQSATPRVEPGTNTKMQSGREEARGIGIIGISVGVPLTLIGASAAWSSRERVTAERSDTRHEAFIDTDCGSRPMRANVYEGSGGATRQLVGSTDQFGDLRLPVARLPVGEITFCLEDETTCQTVSIVSDRINSTQMPKVEVSKLDLLAAASQYKDPPPGIGREVIARRISFLAIKEAREAWKLREYEQALLLYDVASAWSGDNSRDVFKESELRRQSVPLALLRTRTSACLAFGNRLSSRDFLELLLADREFLLSRAVDFGPLQVTRTGTKTMARVIGVPSEPEIVLENGTEGVRVGDRIRVLGRIISTKPAMRMSVGWVQAFDEEAVCSDY